MLKDCSVISLCLLLNLENVNVVREELNLLAGDGIDQSGLSNTVTAYESILATLHKLKLGLVENLLAANYQSNAVNQNVLLERVGLVVHYCRGRHMLFVMDELLHSLLECVSCSLLLLGLLVLLASLFDCCSLCVIDEVILPLLATFHLVGLLLNNDCLSTRSLY